MIFLISFLGLLNFTNAAERMEFYNGIRGLSMGGVQVATVNDETALLVNPAALGKVRDFYGTVADPELDISSAAQNLYANTTFTNPFSLEIIAPILTSFQDTYFHARGQMFPSVVTRNFGLGIFARYELNALIPSPGTAMEVHYLNDAALVLGYAFRFFDGRVKFGFNVRFISRVQIDNEAVDPAGDLTLTGLAKEGGGIGNDVGLILTAPWTYLPTLAIVMRDVGSTKFNAGSGLRLNVAERPDQVNADADVGISFFPIHSPRVRSSISAEYKGALTASEETNSTRRIHYGWELNLSDIFFLRAGMNQGYWTGGVELASERTQVQLGSYGEEVGTATSPKEDRRYMFKFSFRF